MLKKPTSHTTLIDACIKGNRLAQFELYEQHKVFLFGVCLRYVKNRETAEDILQDGFHKIFKNLKQYKANGPIAAWMRKIMVNTALTYLRKAGKMEFFDLVELSYKPAFPSDSSLLDQDRAHAIIYMIQQLPAVYQTVFNLRAMEGYSYKEISEKLEIKEATLRSHYSRARTFLQKRLHQEMK